MLEIRDGRLYDYPGNYSWFLEKREESVSVTQADTHKPAKKAKPNNDALKEIREVKKQVAGAEKAIAEAEARVQEIDEVLCRPETLADSQKVQALMIERDELDRKIKALYSDWEELSIKLENLKE